ncbi:MAG TPA: AraC family transcriptional regulator [Gammaproteobacteria bacterium]|nr:AraC family transcriptional regulator [Gammaproteobacteria bacterium]
MLHEFSGATVKRTLDRSGAEVPEHAHDWPLLSLFVIGAYSNQTEIGAASISGPSALFYAAGAAHRNTAGPEGFEQIEIEFDPAWLRGLRLPVGPVLRWVGGRGGAEAQALVRLCSQGVTEKHLQAALRRFLEAARIESSARRPGWLGDVTRRLKDDPTRKVSDLARGAGLHPSWLGTAYRRAAGEGLRDTAARFRVERAARLLRETDLPLAGIATDAGFCDQSHMIRTFRRVLGRLPASVREDKRHFRNLRMAAAP